MSELIRLKKGEAKTITVTVRDKDTLETINVSAATITFGMSEADDTTTLVTVADGSFDKSDGANGVITFPLSATDTDRVGSFHGELKIEFSGTNIDKSAFIDIEIADAITS